MNTRARGSPIEILTLSRKAELDVVHSNFSGPGQVLEDPNDESPTSHYNFKEFLVPVPR